MRGLLRAIWQDISRQIVLNGAGELQKEIKDLKKQIKKLEEEKIDQEQMRKWTTSYR